MKSIIEADFITPMVAAPDDRPRILIVDNNRDFTLAARLMLQRTGRYQVCDENDARKAMQTARSFKPDLVLLDIAMPEEDGTEVAAELEKDWTLHRVPIVFLTGLVTRAEANSGYRVQGHRVLAKPINISDLIRAIEENLPACAAA
jgi:CheY-like chemotaxis protein